jgi:putative PIN family toxin of toxin-antitoxin system
MRLERVFIDTNVLISAVAFRGNERAVIDLALDDRIRVVFADIVIREARRVVRAKFPALAYRLDWDLLLLDYELVSDPGSSLITKAAEVVRDPKDVEVLASILASKPDVALTGDKDLLTDEVRAIAPTRRCAEYLASIADN